MQNDNIILNGIYMVFEDDDSLQFGNSGDWIIQYKNSGTKFVVEPAADEAILEIGNATQGADITWYAGSNTIVANEGTSTLTLDGVDLVMNDSDFIGFGDSADQSRIESDGTSTFWSCGTDGRILVFGHDTSISRNYELDIQIRGSANANLITWDASADELLFDNCDIRIGDGDLIYFGDGKDVAFLAASNELMISAAADQDKITFGHDATGGAYNLDIEFRGSADNAYVLWDASENELNLTGGGTACDLILKAATSPSNGSDAGTVGKIWWDADYIYIQTASTTVERVAIATW
jgi:hypothetical protein